MNYTIKTITTKEDLGICPIFQVDQYNWGGDYRPKTYGQLGFIPGTGFYLKMHCEEKSPSCTYLKPNDPVCLDSAMEAFFEFYPQTHQGCYLNFEANSAGTLHAKYGYGRHDRQGFPPELHTACQCKGMVFEDYWTLELLIPLTLIHHVYGESCFAKGDFITCNFYKIKESEGRTHFGSFTIIENDTPDFHLPEFFAEAVIG